MEIIVDTIYIYIYMETEELENEMVRVEANVSMNSLFMQIFLHRRSHMRQNERYDMIKICRFVGGKRGESCLIDKRGKYGFNTVKKKKKKINNWLVRIRGDGKFRKN